MEQPNQTGFEEQAEVLVANQLDLIAQLERQLRAVHNTLKQIEKLRNARHRVGPELTNGQKDTVLTTLAAELDVIDRELQTQHESCVDMQRCIEAMRKHLVGIRPTSSDPTRDGKSART